MLKLEVAFPLQIIFQACINSGKFPDCWKYANVQPIHKKENRQIKSNYRPISLLPICDKILEKVVFDQVYAFLNVNNLLSKNNLVFAQVTPRYTNSFLSPQLSMTPLKIMMKHVQPFHTSLKRLMCGTKELFLNLSVMVYLEACLIFLKIIY